MAPEQRRVLPPAQQSAGIEPAARLSRPAVRIGRRDRQLSARWRRRRPRRIEIARSRAGEIGRCFRIRVGIEHLRLLPQLLRVSLGAVLACQNSASCSPRSPQPARNRT